MSRPVLSARRRPSSAIFIGSNGSGPPELPSPPSPVSSNEDLHGLSGRVAHLPSPPHTNSTGSKSSTGSGSVRMPDNSAHRRSFMAGEDDDDEHEHDEDDTARLSDDRRKPENEPERSVQRVKSLTERNRQVLDKIASISSGSRLAAASPTTRAQPSPSATPFPSATVNNRVSFTRSRRELDFSGSETEREGHDRTRSAPEDLADVRRYSAASSDDRSITPPSSSSRRSGEYESSSSRRSGEYESSSSRRSGEYESSSSRRSGEYESSAGSREYRSQRARLISAPSPAASPKRPQLRSLASSAATFNTPASPRSRRLSVSEQYVEEEEEPISITLNRGSSSKKRQPLPREFTTSGSVRRSLDGRTSGFPPETPSRPRSPEAYVGRGSPSPTGSPATFGAPNERSPRVQKPGRAATLRENGHGPSYTASPLSPHRDRRTARWSLSSDLSNRVLEDPDLTTSSRSSRHRPQASESGIGIGTRSSLRSPADPADDVFGRGGRSTTRSIQGVLSRPSTSMGGDEDHQPGRRSRTALSPAPPRAGSGFQSPGTTMRISQQPTSEHAKLMMDALNMFESQLARFTSAAAPASAGGATPTGSGTAPQVHELLRNAATLAQSAQALNTLLRGATARALESQIDAEVGESAVMVDAGEVWRRVGGEYRECLRASDDVVRGVTGVLLGVGRVVRESSSGHLRTGSDDGSAGMSGRRTAEGIRPSTSMSAVRPREQREREREFDDTRDRRRTEEFAPPSATRERASAATLGPRSASRLERRRGGSLEQVEASPTPTPTPANSSNSSRSSDFHSSAHARTLPPISIPPPTPTLPSETLLRRKASTPATSKPRTPASNRLSMASGSSAATIRAAAPASAVVTATTVTSPIGETGGPSRRGALASASFFSTAGRARGASITLSGLQERDAARKRTISATDRDPDAARAAAATIASRQRERDPIPPVPARPRTERRRTVTEMFS